VRIARLGVRLFEQCKHPAVVPFTDMGTAGGMHYLAWPLVEGQTLEKFVQRRGKLPPEEAVPYAIGALEGLDVCHHQGLFHGLLEPSNLMVGPDGQVRILDFGIGCLLAETEGESLVDTMSTANSVNSGLDCASPESIMDPTNLSPVGDQYSPGCVLYHGLSGQYPFPEGTAVEKMTDTAHHSLNLTSHTLPTFSVPTRTETTSGKTGTTSGGGRGRRPGQGHGTAHPGRGRGTHLRVSRAEDPRKVSAAFGGEGGRGRWGNGPATPIVKAATKLCDSAQPPPGLAMREKCGRSLQRRKGSGYRGPKP
jgi:serine/threonine protein kinase